MRKMGLREIAPVSSYENWFHNLYTYHYLYKLSLQRNKIRQFKLKTNENQILIECKQQQQQPQRGNSKIVKDKQKVRCPIFACSRAHTLTRRNYSISALLTLVHSLTTFTWFSKRISMWLDHWAIIIMQSISTVHLYCSKRSHHRMESKPKYATYRSTWCTHSIGRYVYTTRMHYGCFIQTFSSFSVNDRFAFSHTQFRVPHLNDSYSIENCTYKQIHYAF